MLGWSLLKLISHTPLQADFPLAQPTGSSRRGWKAARRAKQLPFCLLWVVSVLLWTGNVLPDAVGFRPLSQCFSALPESTL
jgi:hypothetical protein